MWWICIAPNRENLASKALKCGSQFYLPTYHTCREGICRQDNSKTCWPVAIKFCGWKAGTIRFGNWTQDQFFHFFNAVFSKQLRTDFHYTWGRVDLGRWNKRLHGGTDPYLDLDSGSVISLFQHEIVYDVFKALNAVTQKIVGNVDETFVILVNYN